jgi:hypothetical protein
MFSEANRRVFSRHLIQKQTLLQVELQRKNNCENEPKPFSKKLIDISGGGLSFKSDLKAELFLPGTFLADMRVISSGKCLLQTSGEVKHIYCDQGDINASFYKVGVEFDIGLGENEHKFQSGSKNHHEQIISPLTIINHLNDIIENDVPVSLKVAETFPPVTIIGYFSQIDTSAKFSTIIFRPNHQDVNTFLFEELDRVQILYQFKSNGYIFNSVIVSQSNNAIMLKLPRSICRLWQRSTLRYIPARDDSIRISFDHPLLKAKHLDRKLLDLTPNGLSFAIESPDDLLIKDMLIPQMALIIPDHKPFLFSAKVKYISMVLDEKLKNYFKCGLSFVNLSSDKINFLVSYILNKNFPYLKDAQGENLQTLWTLFHDSGFIYNEKRNFLAPIEKETTDTFKKLLMSSNRFYKNIILKEGNKCYGTVSGIWAYERTWIIQHLATLKHPQKIVPMDMVLFSADFCSKNPDVGYQKIFWRANNSWPDKVFGKYARLASQQPDSSNLIRYDYLFKSSLEDCQQIELPAGVVIKPLTKNEHSLIESYFVNRQDLVTLQADSLLREEIDLPCTRRMFRQEGLMRERQIYVAKSSRHFLGFVLIEDSSLGINLSGLLNYFKVYTTAECGGMEVKVKAGLICKATEYFKQRGRDFAICLANNEDLRVYESLGYKKKKEYLCWTVSQKLAQPYFNYLKEYFARIEKRLVRKIQVG